MAVVVVVGLLGCSDVDEAGIGGSSTGAPGPRSAGDASATPAASLRAALTAELEARVHLLVAYGAAERRGAEAEEVDVGRALRDRRDAIEVALVEAGVADADELVDVLEGQDEVLLAYAAAPTRAAARRVRAGLASESSRLAEVAEAMTGGRLPVDVALPLALGHLAALCDVADAQEEGGSDAAGLAVEGALVTGSRLLEPVVLALSAEFGLVGAPAGDAAEVRSELTSAFVQHGFGAASSVLGGDGGDALVAGAADRFAAVVAGSYGAEVAGRLRARWTDHVSAAEDASAAAATLRLAATAPARAAAGPAAALTEQRSDDAIAALADLLADIVDDDAVAEAVEDALEEHRSAMTEVRLADRPASGAWRTAADAALALSGLAGDLASAVTKQKTLG